MKGRSRVDDDVFSEGAVLAQAHKVTRIAEDTMPGAAILAFIVRADRANSPDTIALLETSHSLTDHLDDPARLVGPRQRQFRASEAVISNHLPRNERDKVRDILTESVWQRPLAFVFSRSW